MSIGFDDRLQALMELCDADAEARHDLQDGYVPDSLEVQWERAVATLVGHEEHAELLLISLMNAGWIIGAKSSMRSDDSPHHAPSLVYRYGGLTRQGRWMAAEHGWVDTD